MKQITGGCACGAVFYVPANGFKITKRHAKHYSRGSEMISDNIRVFCPECGSQLFGGKSDFGQGIADPKLPKFKKYVPRG